MGAKALNGDREGQKLTKEASLNTKVKMMEKLYTLSNEDIEDMLK